MDNPLIQRINETLSSVRDTLWSSMSKLMNRGETVEYLEQASKDLEVSSRVFEVKVVVYTAPWWLTALWWVFPCWRIGCCRRGWRWVKKKYKDVYSHHKDDDDL